MTDPQPAAPLGGMSMDIGCAICGYEMSVDQLDPARLEHVVDVFNRSHAHTSDELHDFIMANGRGVVWSTDDDDDGDGDGDDD